MGRSLLRERLLPQAVRDRRAAGQEGEGVRRFADGGGDPRPPRNRADGRGRQPVPLAVGERESGSTAANEGRRVSRRRACAACQDRHGAPEHDHARSAATADQARASLSAGGCVVHLPAVRLRARALGRVRGDHALVMHARVQGQSRDLRLACPRGGIRASADADRVRAPRAGLHRPEQAQAAAPRERRVRQRVG